MKRTLMLGAPGLSIASAGASRADDPFAAGADALAVAESDGSSSVRAKLKTTKLAANEIMVRVKSPDARAFPRCTFTAKVLTKPTSEEKHFKLIARGKVYRFAATLKMKGKQPALSDKTTQKNLGACYYSKKTKLRIKVSGVDLKRKVFRVAEITPK